MALIVARSPIAFQSGELFIAGCEQSWRGEQLRIARRNAQYASRAMFPMNKVWKRSPS
ncbi:MAG: hypothetical protein P8Y53_17960 [Pseudolabrys sp.]